MTKRWSRTTSQMDHRSEILQWLVEKFDYKDYLEIGVAIGATYKYVDVPGLKHGVDPDIFSLDATHTMTSDEFFPQCTNTYDLIFVEGLHRGEQAYKDVLAAMEILNENGTIAVHDCSPPDENCQLIPRIQMCWTGDVWRGWLKLRQLPDLYMEVVDTDYGVGIIRRGEQEPIEDCENITYKDFDKDRTRLLNLVSADNILKGLFNDPASD